ncbi:hypothetical protein GW931_00060 [archaeon]|nr:hypothetical protein [archaeon]PJC45353.1 MAG: hypothetical protein CO037_02045 [Candidatus Pacearchaeota archaeon CG_4_9_14_0_2_um_filter_30_8]
MENKKVGWLIIGISVAMGILVWIFNKALQEIIAQTCKEGPSCIMHQTATTQLAISLSIVLVILAIGIYIMFSKPDEKIVIKKIKGKEKKKVFDLSKLDKEEKEVIEILINEEKAMFQKDLMEKLEIGKVKMTRLLDKLEAKQFIIRKRRGMNNIVVLK